MKLVSGVYCDHFFDGGILHYLLIFLGKKHFTWVIFTSLFIQHNYVFLMRCPWVK